MSPNTKYDMLNGSGSWDEARNDEILFIPSTENEPALEISTVCPHFGGPLNFEEDSETLHCPWHGWRFNARTGRCLNRETNVRLRLYEG